MDKWWPSKLQHYWELPEFWEESWRHEEAYCHSNSRERPSAKAEMKNSNNNNNNNSKIVDLDIPANHRIKMIEWEKKDKYLDLARELKKLWNMKVTIIPIVIDAFGTVTKGLLKALDDLVVGGRVKTIQTITLLRATRILGRVLETWVDLLSLKLQSKNIS